MLNVENLWPKPQQIKTGDEFEAPQKVCLTGASCNQRRLRDFQEIGHLTLSKEKQAFPLTLTINPAGLRREGYHLTLSSSGAAIVGADEQGLDYGLETLLQIVALCRSTLKWPTIEITDWPDFKKTLFYGRSGTKRVQ